MEKQKKEKKAREKDQDIGLTVKKENMSEWYTQVVTKAKLADYSPVSGCIVFMPNSYSIWERIRYIVDKKLKETEHKNAYFPLLIPERLLIKESEHVKGFSPEVAWVTQAGDTKLNERLAIRPTSETIMYETYSRWIRSWRDLPLLINQWCNIVRWEFKYAKPFLRTREFLWQEGHTVHSTEKDAEKELMFILNNVYKDLIENYLAIPTIVGKKTENEKFAGAVYTMTLEALMPDGKALQLGTSHMLGQNFSKPFDIKFLDKDGKQKYAWQTSWGVSTRLIGALIMTHGDDKGIILPPKIAPVQIVIIPILFEKGKDEIIKKANEIKEKLEKEFSVIIDLDESHKPGWKFNQYELEGIPLRIEIGPKDVKDNKAIAVRRDTFGKISIDIKDINKKVKDVLDDIQDNLFKRAKKFLKDNIIEVKNFEEFKEGIKQKKLVKAYFCGSTDCEDSIKEETSATARCIVGDVKGKEKCIYCGKKARYVVYFGRNY